MSRSELSKGCANALFELFGRFFFNLFFEIFTHLVAYPTGWILLTVLTLGGATSRNDLGKNPIKTEIYRWTWRENGKLHVHPHAVTGMGFLVWIAITIVSCMLIWKYIVWLETRHLTPLPSP